jgi:hypothetical protein
MRLMFVLLGVLFLESTVMGQHHSFQPMDTYGKEDQALLDELDRNISEERDQIRGLRGTKIGQIYSLTARRLKAEVTRHEWIKDRELQRLVESVVEQLNRSNPLQYPPKIIAIRNDPTANAIATIGRTLIVHVGLIAKVSSESQLAFTLAHELAHMEQQHVRQRLEKIIEERTYEEELKTAQELLTNHASAETIQKMKDILYDMAHFNREMETEADRMAVRMMQHAGYDPRESVRMLTVLDPLHLDSVNADFMFQLDLPTYPLKDEWLRKRPAYFSAPPEKGIFIRSDSVYSHPELLQRIAQLMPEVSNTSGSATMLEESYLKRCLLRAAYQQVEAAISQERLDYGLYLALKLRERHLRSSYLTAKIATVFTFLYERKDHPYYFSKVLPDFTYSYNEELRLVNDFLHNMKREELGDMAYYFLTGSNFDPQEELHYYLLWKICAMTDRAQEKKNVKRNHDNLFPRGKYVLSIYIPWSPKKRRWNAYIMQWE